MALMERLIDIAEEHTVRMFDEMRAYLRDEIAHTPGDGRDHGNGVSVGDPLMRKSGSSEPWSADTLAAPAGGWLEMSRAEQGESYTWPDASIDQYAPFATYAGTGANTGTTLALGYKDDGTVVGFIVGAAGGSKRGLTVFFKCEDFDRSNERISMIRGGGPRGRAGFGPADALPAAYQGFKVEILRDRVAGKWNVQAVVADADDVEAMLNHTMLQAKLRGLA